MFHTTQSPAETELPFSLEIHGTKWGNLLRIPSDDSAMVRPFVRTEGVTLETSIDESGGSLTFEVEQMVTPGVISLGPDTIGTGDNGPWWHELNLPDNAIVEFRTNRAANPAGGVQSRLFMGFIDSIETRPNGGGKGTVTLVTCVSSNALLDRIVVRKPMAGKAAKRRGQTTGRITIKRGTDRQQIRQLLRFAGNKRSFGPILLFNPADHRQVAQTSAAILPRAEIPVGTLREALETIVEAAQQNDGRRRSFHIDPLTGALFYGRGESGYFAPIYGSYGEKALQIDAELAPYIIVDRPEDEALTWAAAASHRQEMIRLRPTAYFPLSASLVTWPFGTCFQNAMGNSGTVKRVGSGADPFPSPAAPAARNISPGLVIDGKAVKIALPGLVSGGPRTISAWMTRNGKLRIGGTNGMQIWVSGSDPGNPDQWNVGYSGSWVGTDNPLSNTPPTFGSEWDTAIQHLVFVFKPGVGCTLYVNGTRCMTDNGPTTLPAQADEIRFLQNTAYGGEAAVFCDVAFFNRALDDEEVALLWTAATWPWDPNGAYQQAPSSPKIMGRDLRLTVDHSRVTKIGVFLAADSKSDRDNDPDPYVRKYDAILLPDYATRPVVEYLPKTNAPSTGNPLLFREYDSHRAFDLRRGPRFESLIEASTVRAGTPRQRSEKITRLARGYFGYRRMPEVAATVSIRGAGASPGQEYGFAGAPNYRSDGSFGYYEWAPGQTVRVVNEALGLSLEQNIANNTDIAEMNGAFRIISITMRFEPGSFIRRFDLELGRRAQSTIASLIAGE